MTRGRLRGRQGVDVDEGLDLVIAGGGVGDDLPAVGVPDQDDRAGDAVQEVGQVGRVVGQPLEGVRWRVHGVPVSLQALDNGVPAAAVSPRPVLQHDGGLGPVTRASRAARMGRSDLADRDDQAGQGRDCGHDDKAQPA
jgi:hypothetical protein